MVTLYTIGYYAVIEQKTSQLQRLLVYLGHVHANLLPVLPHFIRKRAL